MATTVDSRQFVDTNILIYATDTRSPYHVRAQDALNNARARGISLVISNQVLREYLAVTTRQGPTDPDIPRREIFENVRILREEFEVVEDSDTVFDCLMRLLEEVPTGGKQIHDANIVATMQAHGIRRLLTFNTADFARFAHLLTLLDI